MYYSIYFKLSNGKFVDFLRRHWLGYSPLNDLFPTLFQRSALHWLKMGETGSWCHNSWVWDIDSLDVALNDNDNTLLAMFILLFNGVEPKPHIIDHFVWQRLKDEFSIKDCWKGICKAYVMVPLLDPLKYKVTACLWKSKVPKFLFLVRG